MKSQMQVPLETCDGISLMQIRKSSGPRTIPCGTPERTSVGSELSPSTMTLILCPVRKGMNPAVCVTLDTIVS